MVRILFLLMIVLFSDVKIATAQSSETATKTSCDRFNLSLQQDKVVALPQNNPIVSRRLISQTSGRSSDTAKLEFRTENSFNSAISFSSSQDKTQRNFANEEQKIATAEISLPSLWWAKEQFDPFGGKLISSWLTYPQIKQIDLTVNWQLWTLLDYLGRYRFINQFGTVAREYGYSLRIFNQQQQCLAYYEYNTETNPPKWEINIEGIGQDSLQVEPVN